MKVFSPLLTLFLLASCSYDSSNESGFIVVGHKPVEDAFVLTLPSNAAYNEGDNLNFVLTHPKTVTVDTTGGAPDITISVGGVSRTASYNSGTGSRNLVFRYTIQAGEEDMIGVQVTSTQIALNGGSLQYEIDGTLYDANPEIIFDDVNSEILVDTSLPDLIQVSAPLPGTYRLGEPLTFIAVYDSPIIVSDTPRLQLNIGGVTQYADYYLGSGTSIILFRYVVQATDSDTDGISVASPIQLNAGTMYDLGSNAADLIFTPPDTSLVDVEADAPYPVLLTMPADDTYSNGEYMNLTIQFNETVNVNTGGGTPSVGVTVGGSVRQFDYYIGTGSNTLGFRYLVTSSDYDMDGVMVSNWINLNGGTITNATPTDAILEFDAFITPNVLVYGGTPTIVTLSAVVDGDYVTGADLEFTAQYSEPVNIANSPSIDINIGGVTRQATYASGTGSDTIVYTYNIQSGDSDGDGIAFQSTNINLNTTGTVTSVLTASNASTDFSGPAPTISGITVNNNPATQLVITTEPINTAVSTNIPSITVELRDASNNLVASETSNVSVAINVNPGGGTLSGTTTVAAVGGVATFSDLQIDALGNGYTLDFTSTGLTSATSATFDITAAGATKLRFVQQPSNALAGANNSPAMTVEILDAANNRVTSATNNITLALSTDPSSGAATLGGTLTVAAVSGVATFSDITIDKAFTGYLLDATATGLNSDTSTSFDISPNTKSILAFSVEPSNAESNTNIAPAIEVEIQDAYGNKTTDTDSITLAINSNPSAGTLSGTASVNAVAGVATFSNLQIDNTGVSYDLNATATGLTGATSASFDITTTPTQLVITQEPTNTDVNATISPAITVEIRDGSNNLVTSATDNVTVAIGTNPGTGLISGTTTVAAVGGVATFNDLSIDEVQNGYDLTFTATGLTSDTSASFNITPATATKLVYNVEPSNTTAGSNITAAIQVYITDASDNLITTATDNVTLAFGTDASSGAATLGGTLTVAASGGIATFSGINIDKAFTGYTLTASAAGLSSATSVSFDISPNTATKLGFAVDTTSAPINTAISPSMEVSILDAYDNVVTGASSTVTIAFENDPSSGSATLGGTASKAAVSGVATFDNITIDTTGTGYSFIATATGLTSASSSLFNVYSTPTKLAFGTQPANTLEGNNLPPFTVEIQDANGNVVTDETRAVTIAFQNDPSSGAATLSGTLSVAAVAGVATFSGIDVDTAFADYSFLATASGLTADTSNPFDIIIAAPTAVTLINPASSPDSDTTPQFRVSGVANGDIVKLYTDSSCTTQVSSYTSSGATVDMYTSSLLEGVYTIYANRTDSNGTPSQCSTAFEDYEVSGSFYELTSFAAANFGFWENVAGDDRDWTSQTGLTGEPGAGPTGAASGMHYAYTDSSNPVGNSEEFILQTTNNYDGSSNTLAIGFKWNKRGSPMGDLYLEVSNNGGSTWTTEWSHTGVDVSNYGADQWRNQWVDVCNLGYTATNVKFRFRAVMPATGDPDPSNIAIDELEITSGGCESNPPAEVAITYPSSDTVVGITNMSSFTIGGTCSDIGQNITLSGDVSGSTSCTGGNDWSITLNLASHPDGNIEVDVDHTDSAGGANGQDTITYVKDGNTIQLDEFEVGLGSWTQDTGDAQDFSWITGDTPTSNVGPSTGQGGSGYYLFTEASNPTNNSDDFIIYSGDLDAASYNLNLSYYWNKRGDNMGTIYVEVSTDSGVTWDTAVWTHAGADVAKGGTDVWNQQSIDLCSAGYNTGTAMIRFRILMPATGGNYWNSDIGLDTIKVTNDGCP